LNNINMMKKRGILGVLFILLAVNVTAVEFSTSDRLPMVSVTFLESSYVEDATITNDFEIFRVQIYKNPLNKTYRFQSLDVLPLGEYDLIVKAVDVAGNPSKRFTFPIEIVPLKIDLLKPRFGYATSEPFTLEIETEVEALCKYSKEDDFTLPLDRAPLFPVTDGIIHTHSSLNWRIRNGISIYMLCNDTYEVTPKLFDITLDSTPPVISRFVANPNPVVDDRETTLIVDTDDDTICKFDNVETDYHKMSNVFPGWDDQDENTFVKQHTHSIKYTEDQDQQSFNYNVRCENKGGALSEVQTVTVKLDFSAPLEITVNTPEYVSTNRIWLNLSTNREAECFDESDSLGPVAKEHSKLLSNLVAGKHTYEIECESSQTVTKTVEFTVDLTKPLIQNITVSENACKRDDSFVMDLEFNAEDNESGIDFYEYKLEGIFDWVKTTENEVRVDSLPNGGDINLSYNQDYKFKVRAMNKAGSYSTEVLSEAFKAKRNTDVECLENMPPYIVVIEKGNSLKANITLNCRDKEGRDNRFPSGCNNNKTKYGLSSQKDLCFNSDNDYDGNFFVEQNTWLCWYAEDKAENVGEGFHYINLSKLSKDTDGDGIINGADNCPNVVNPNQIDSDFDGVGDACEPASQEGCLIDNDNDGYGYGCYNGLDCNDQDSSKFKGCLNGCRSDGDGDGFGMGCTNGQDCNDQDATLTSVCASGCRQDNDGDEYGLGCIKGNDCNDADNFRGLDCTNGCRQDSDGDGYGMGCDLGNDCDETNYGLNSICSNKCYIDNDGDGYGLGCQAGLDCDDTLSSKHIGCVSGCSQDSDGDGSGFNCGYDCDDTDSGTSEDCSSGCIHDGDGDGFGYGCKGDCNDGQKSEHVGCDSKCVLDLDTDGFGLGCENGPDCNDYNPLTSSGCVSDCTFDIECDTLGDEWENLYGLDTSKDDKDDDLDKDGKSNLEEYRLGREPNFNEEKNDRDGDGMDDTWEEKYKLNPRDPSDAIQDPDKDGLTNREEYELTVTGGYLGDLNPLDKDTDQDGYDDKREVDGGFDPTDPNSKPQPILAVIFLSLGILMMGGGFGYVAYKKFRKKSLPRVNFAKPSFQPKTLSKPKVISRPAPNMHGAFMNKVRAKRQDLSKVFKKFKSKESTFEKVQDLIPKSPTERLKNISAKQVLQPRKLGDEKVQDFVKYMGKKEFRDKVKDQKILRDKLKAKELANRASTFNKLANLRKDMDKKKSLDKLRKWVKK